jgi:hypothetical protein
MNLTFDQGVELIRAVAEIAIIPLVAVLWKLNNSINDLHILMYKEFVTKEEHDKWRRLVRSDLSSERNESHHQNELDF